MPIKEENPFEKKRSRKKIKKESGAIWGDGMCPYVPCKDYPNCKHVKGLRDEK